MSAGLMVLDEGKRKVVTGVGVTLDSGTQLDSFGRLRVSDINNFFESTHVNSEQIEFWDVLLVGGASKVYNAQKAQVELTCGTASGDRALRQTLNYFHYAAGQSMIIRLTGLLTSGKTNFNACCGYYNDDNGLIFRVSDGVFQVGIRSDTSGSVVETWVNQSAFNGDRLDGTAGEFNPSGLTIDLDEAQIFEVNYQWLGVGDVRFVIHINGKAHIIHTFHHANTVDTVYMRTPHLPIRYEMMNTGVTASATTINQICTQAANEGKALIGDLVDTVDNDTTTIAINNSSYKPVISMRAKNTTDLIIQLEAIGVMVTTADDMIVKIFADMTLTGATWTDHSTRIQQDVASTAASGGRHIASLYINKDGKSFASTFKDKFRLGQYIDGTRQTVTVVAKTFSNNASMVGSISFKELF